MEEGRASFFVRRSQIFIPTFFPLDGDSLKAVPFQFFGTQPNITFNVIILHTLRIPTIKSLLSLSLSFFQNSFEIILEKISESVDEPSNEKFPVSRYSQRDLAVDRDEATPESQTLERHSGRPCRLVARRRGVARRWRQDGRSCEGAEYYSAAARTSNSPKILPAKGKMHIEVQVALNFVISYLYNKLPRRRVNIFGEELEKALKDKFKGHWYPEKPFKGSAFRCLKTGDPVDPVLEKAAKESGVPIQDILENLPAELAVWVDPGEVSYRIGEMNAVKILYSETGDPHDESSADREVTKTFNPEAQCFRPIEAVGTSLGGLSLSPKSTSPFPSSLGSNASNGSSNNQQSGHGSGSSSAPSPTPITSSFKGSPSPVPAFIPRTTAPLTFTTATFAQTKFGSTKLKTSSKRANRLVDSLVHVFLQMFL